MTALADARIACSDCGTPLSGEEEISGLCPRCLMGLAVDAPSLLAELEEAPTKARRGEGLGPERVPGERYQLRSLLGRGGMGEVWRAFDLKLRLDVALKALRLDRLGDRRALESLRQEVRTAREVASPNVCRVYDLVELGGRELVAMEYVDGTTLAEVIRARGPLDLDEARQIAAQFLAGLEAIHGAGLVHRDLKPDNLMLTRAGRVVVMDFGIAQGLREALTDTIIGTPAYMAPEQLRGDALDARTDVFAAGVVLAELVAPERLATPEARRRLLEGLRREPAEVPDTPWAAVIRRAVSPDPAARYPSAAALARALEEVTLRSAGDEDLRPYPGLASFTEAEAEYFFGRELEVEEMVKKLGRAHLLALIGPSGAGKSSFLRAGLLSALPEGWSAIVATPGSRPFTALARALAPELSGDTEAVEQLLEFEDPDVAVGLLSRWRRRHDQALIVLDQFEELFTLNPPEVQDALASLLSRLTLEADAHVLLGMRDDFLARSQPFEGLRPILSELTLLGPLSGSALRRALVQPALKCGYKFEDEALVEAMVAEVEGERGALPLVAFAAARLWEHRDRERGLLTRAAYEHIGGVAGALAQHAEATLETIGREREPIVRELFRNLITAEGTRAARDRRELLSVFHEGPFFAGEAEQLADALGAERQAAAEVLDALVDARLLTSYELAVPEGDSGDEIDEDTEPGDRIEIIHESLLSAWPRLVRWRAQDQEGALLRDQLRQAAQLWDQRQRSDDFLWTGTAYREYELWRERYPGGLSELEASFAAAMTRHALRRRRRRRLAVAAAFAALLAVLAVVGVSRQQALAAARRAEAQRLVTLAELELATMPTVALAYATKSLEVADSREARLMAVRALAAGPPATVLLDGAYIAFSPNEEWAVLHGIEELEVLSRDGRRRRLEPFPPGTRGTGTGAMTSVSASFTPDGQYLFAGKEEELRVYSVPDFELVETQVLPAGPSRIVATRRGMFAISTQKDRNVLTALAVGEPPRRIGEHELSGEHRNALHRSGRWYAFSQEGEMSVRSLDAWEAPARRVGPQEFHSLTFHPLEDWLIAHDMTGRIRSWSLESGDEAPLRSFRTDLSNGPAVHPAGTLLLVAGERNAAQWVEINDLTAPADAAPLAFPVTLPFDPHNLGPVRFAPGGRWIVSAHDLAIGWWPLPAAEPRLLVGDGSEVTDLAFTPDGRGLVSADLLGEIRLWDLDADGVSRRLGQFEDPLYVPAVVEVSASGRFVVAAGRGGPLVIPLDGGLPRTLEGFSDEAFIGSVAVDPHDRFVAAGGVWGPASEKVIRLWDLETGATRTLGPTDQTVDWWSDLSFLPDGALLSSGDGGLRLWSLGHGNQRIDGPPTQRIAVFEAGRRVAFSQGSPPNFSCGILDLETRTTSALPAHGVFCEAVAVDTSGSVVVTGGDDGAVRVGPVSGEEPHLLLGHQGTVYEVTISPDGRWIASGGEDRTIRLWPMPDTEKPPLHTLPLAELLSKLHALTNVRVVEDPESPSGWKIDAAPFPGWETVPEW